jgi:hypothetical protein
MSGSRVHCCSLDQGGARLCPCGLAVPTPQTFSTAFRRSGFTNPEKFPAGELGMPPLPAPIRQVRAGLALRGFTTSVPYVLLSIHAHPGPRHLAVLTHPGLVGAAPTITDTSRLRLPPASTDRCDGPQVQVSHLHSNSSASRRTKPALNAFAITFADRMPTKTN